jgi:hypothetical protein
MTMTTTVAAETWTCDARLAALRRTKVEHTVAKRARGYFDGDDHGWIMPPDGYEFTPVVRNHPNGSWYGSAACGANFRAFLEGHPLYLDPMSSIAGAFRGYCSRPVHWKPEISYAHLQPDIDRYGIIATLGGGQHFAPDLGLGMPIGWGGILERVRRFHEANRDNPDAEPGFYEGIEDAILGTQAWIRQHAELARQMAANEGRPSVRANLDEIAAMNERLATMPPRTLREACQWLSWFQLVAQMYNGSGALAQLDEVLQPYYERDVETGILTDEEAVFHVACLFLTENDYSQIGGQAPDGRDRTCRMSYWKLPTGCTAP